MKKILLLTGFCCFALKAFANCDENGKCVWDCSPEDSSGSCTATFENGTLTVSGTGKMADFSYTAVTDETYPNLRAPDSYDNHLILKTYAPWNDEEGHLSQITNIVVEEGITSVGNKSFAGAVNLQNVSLPDGLEAIGQHAFYLTGLTSVSLPASLETIGNITGSGGGSFQYTNLTSIELPDGLKTISSSVFRNTLIESVVIPDSVEIIGTRAFLNNENLKSVIIGDGVVSIGREAFANTPAYIYCQNTAERSCADLIGENNSDALGRLKIYSIDDKGRIKVGSKTYTSLNDLPKYVLRRIYTVEEATAASGEKNTVILRYK
ncbi:MAG: leucine-rich repeat domain-containing protein [Alphaproteobacteria bacterium]|nr:leucine-rich repeat domain-containing protein [Alphaproteobacteria bacterium]